MTNLDQTLGAIYRKDYAALSGLTPAEINASDEDGRTPLMHAVLEEDADPSLVRLLIDRGADVNAADRDEQWTALHFAARSGTEAIVDVLLDAGATVDPVNLFGNTPLWESITRPKSNIAVVKKLVRRGADPRKRNNLGVSPIDLARTVDRGDLVRLLTEDVRS